MTSVPTMAPARLVIPPMMSITIMRKVMLRKKASGLNDPMNMPKSAPAAPTKKAEMTNATARSRPMPMPTARAAASSSREARRRRPMPDR